MQFKLDPDQSLNDISRKQKLAPPKLIEYLVRKFSDRTEAMARAYLSQHYTLEEVGRAFGVSYATVSRAVKRHGLGGRIRPNQPHKYGRARLQIPDGWRTATRSN